MVTMNGDVAQLDRDAATVLMYILSVTLASTTLYNV